MNRRLILLVSAVALVGAAYVLGWSTLFTVSSIEISISNLLVLVSSFKEIK